MGLKMTGVWTRRPDMEFATQQDLEKAKYYAMMMSPFTIRSSPDLRGEYASIYGTGELVELDVKGGVWVRGVAKTEAVLTPGPDEEIQHTPFGDRIVKKGSTVPASGTPIATITHEELEALMDESMLRCLKRVFPERF